MEVKKISSAKARKNFSDLLNQCGIGGDRIVVTRKGKAVAAMVPMEDLLTLAELEDKLDIATAIHRRLCKIASRTKNERYFARLLPDCKNKILE